MMTELTALLASLGFVGLLVLSLALLEAVELIARWRGGR